MRSRLPTLLAVVGALLLTVGLVAGILNREVVDGSRFVAHVDAIRKDPAVSRQVALAITARVLEADPDLVAVRPLLESASQTLVSGSTFGAFARATAAQAHGAFTGSAPVVLRIADIGAVMAAIVSTLAPRAAEQLPANLDVTLAHVGSQSFAADAIHLVHRVELLAWLLPLLAMLFFIGAVVLSRDRRRGLAKVGIGVFSAGAMLALLGFAIRVVMSFQDTDTLSGAVAVAAWDELSEPVWRAAAVAMIAGAIFAVAVMRVRRRGFGELLSAGWVWMVHDNGSAGQRLARAAVWIVLGLGLVTRPLVFVSGIAVALGVVALVTGGYALIGLARERLAEPSRVRRRFALDPRWWRAIGLALGAALVVSFIVVLARPAETSIAAGRQAAYDGPCNGYVVLCSRRYDDVAYAATHNSMAVADEPNWFLAEQPTGLVGQLDDGIRVLLIDTWYGQRTRRSDVIATAARNQTRAMQEAVETYGRDVVNAALRVRDAASLDPTGPPEPYLCHGLCELGATKLEPALAGIRSWMAAHPREVVTLFIQDQVTPADTATVFERAGLMPFVHTQQPGAPWPTLGRMIATGHRLVVLMERRGGGSTYPWLLQGFDWVQETPFDFGSPGRFSCRLNRGAPGAPLFLVNHWLNRFRSRVSDSARVNAYDVLWPRVEKCEEERDKLPNYVAVNFYDKGDLFQVVDQLNGVG